MIVLTNIPLVKSTEHATQSYLFLSHKLLTTPIEISYSIIVIMQRQFNHSLIRINALLHIAIASDPLIIHNGFHII